MRITPLDSASCAIATPVGPSSGSMIRTLAPRLMSAVASLSSVASLPCALSIRYCVGGLNWPMVGPMLRLKELMLSPDGTPFEPLGAVDDEDDVDDDPQPAA